MAYVLYYGYVAYNGGGEYCGKCVANDTHLYNACKTTHITML